MKRVAILLALLTAGCASAPAPAPIEVTVAGPRFTPAAFDCDVRPMPPDPHKAGGKAGSAAAHYENALGTWGQRCSNKLQSVGQQLEAAGLVTGAEGAAR